MGHKKHRDIPMLSHEELQTLAPDGGPRFNRLIFSSSPYLLQHAENPVDWYPWGEEAFAAAARDDKPIFLSIGYATCHWCHVMAHESFEDEEIAALLNEAFVCIKVDREERPDLDNIYMSVCQAMTGHGGWPLTVLMTADRKPFFTGTYFPRESRPQMIGMRDLISRVKELWSGERQGLMKSVEEVMRFLEASRATEPGAEPEPSLLDSAYEQLKERFDGENGGFGGAPKFPTPHNYLFLLRYFHRTGKREALEMVEQSLRAMRNGGIFDHIGYGFHRYSTDANWLVPHFEKMLYDQALMAMACLETWQAGGQPEFEQTAREIFEYVLRDMTSPEGGFYSAEDADSEGEEGRFYLWSPDEVEALLPAEEAALWNAIFTILAEGNFRDESTGAKNGRNIPHLNASLEKLASEHSLSAADLEKFIDESRQKLFKAREARIHPLKDDKILTDWNGLMIAALSRGAALLDAPEYLHAAQKASDFLWDRLRDENGNLLKRYRSGGAGLTAHLDDYAFLCWGYLELYEAGFEVRNLQRAIDITEQMLQRFGDIDDGGLYFAEDNPDELLVRSKEYYDGAIPSGNSVAMMNLLRIGRITADPAMEARAFDIARAGSRRLARSPVAHTMLLSALSLYFGADMELVLVGDQDGESFRELLRAARSRYLPNLVTIHRPDGEAPEITDIAPYTAAQKKIDGAAAAYVCRNYACRMPTGDPGVMLGMLSSAPG
jgi:uncharacterized protein YyaL (SSP411 family)